MDRVCVRPGCDRPARARLAYDTVTCQVWLDQLLDRSGRAQEICELHAERLTVPRGWMLCDRRAEAPALFVAEVAAPVDDTAGGEAPARRRRRSRRDGDDTRNLFDEIAADISEAPIEVVMAPHLAVVGGEVAVGDVAAGDAAAVESEGVSEPAPEPEPVRTPEPVREPAPAAAAGEPEHEGTAELSVLKATSPLLARAFSQTGPQRSVLTQSNGDDATD